MPLPPTPGHTIGPFFHDAFRWLADGTATDDPALGEIFIEGQVLDGLGEPLPAWLVEAWAPQAVAAEARAGREAPGFRRLMSDASGAFRLRVPAPEAGQPVAFITLFGVGLTRHHFTLVFLPDAAASPMLDGVPPERRATLVAERVGEGRYQWNLRTRGERETVFFDYR